MLRRLAPLALLAVLVSLAVAACGSPPPEAEPSPTPLPGSPETPPSSQEPSPIAPTATSAPNGSQNGGGTEVSVNLEDPGGSGAYAFDPSEFTFSAGESVSFKLTSETEFHTFTVEELGINVSVNANETETLDFTFDEPGTYTLICVPHEFQGMTGTITVQ